MTRKQIPTAIKFSKIEENETSLSPSQYQQIPIENSNVKPLRYFLSRELRTSDKGREVGSDKYISRSDYFFLRTGALHENSLLPIIDSVSSIPILPNVFIDMNLRKGDILISKDSNVGVSAILDKDYPNYMLCGGIYKLPLDQWKYYVLAFLKSDYFIDQLLIQTSRGSTLKHAKTRFLDCLIPLPTQGNSDQVIKLLEEIVNQLISLSIIIKHKNDKISELISFELESNQNISTYHFNYPTISYISNQSRIDTGLYVEEFRSIEHLLYNYSNGYEMISSDNIRSGSTPKKRVNSFEKKYPYQWITPSYISDYGTIQIEERINCPQSNLSRNATLIINRTSRGGIGEYVGMSTYFDIDIFGRSQHNQGFYRVMGLGDDNLIFLTCFMNSKIMRKYCSFISLGSKMKEIKLDQISSIPIPNFPEQVKKEINNQYYNPHLDNEIKSINNDEFRNWLNNAGIINIDQKWKSLNKIKEEIIDILLKGEEVDVNKYMNLI